MKQLGLLCCSDSDTGSFNGFLQLHVPIRPTSISPLSVFYGIMGWGMFVCMHSCIHVCMHKYNVYLCICMYYVCSLLCMYTNTDKIYNARNVTPKCESEARNHTYMMHVCTQ